MSQLNFSNHNKLYGLDHLRALAIILVFLFHYQLPFFGHPVWLSSLAKFGWTGVDLFFVLSGFLIASQLFEQIKSGTRVSFARFFLKRAFRIFPAYWVVTALYFCLPVFHERESLPPLWKLLTFTQNLGLDLSTSGTFSHAWSLCVEEHFYFFLPLILIALQVSDLFKKAYWLIPVLFVFCLATRWYSWNHFYSPNIGAEGEGIIWYKYIYYPTYTRLDGLLTGVSVAMIYCFLPQTWRVMERYGNLFIFSGVAVLIVTGFAFPDIEALIPSLFCFALVAIGYGLMVAGAVSKGSILHRWQSGVTSFIAGLSYSIYLLHKGVIHITQLVIAKLGYDTNTGLVMVCCIISCIISAFLLNAVIEKPFLRLRDNLLQMR